MTKTKGEIVNRAYSWLRISGLTSPATPKENEKALEVLEGMMAEYNSRNICTTFIFEDVPDEATESGIPLQFFLAASYCLGRRMAPDFGKQITQLQDRAATGALANWTARTAKVNQINQPNRMARGNGNTFRFQSWFRYYRTDADAPISCDTLELSIDEIDFFDVNFNTYLKTGETITSFTVDSTNGVEVLNTELSGTVITLKCKGKLSGFQTVTLTLQTSGGRSNPAVVNFNITP